MPPVLFYGKMSENIRRFDVTLSFSVNGLNVPFDNIVARILQRLAVCKNFDHKSKAAAL